jgi:hypothetical protein
MARRKNAGFYDDIGISKFEEWLAELLSAATQSNGVRANTEGDFPKANDHSLSPPPFLHRRRVYPPLLRKKCSMSCQHEDLTLQHNTESLPKSAIPQLICVLPL